MLGALVLLLTALPPDCAEANALIRREAASLLTSTRLPAGADIIDRWRDFVTARHRCPYARLLLINDDNKPDLALLMPAKAGGYTIAVLLSGDGGYSLQIVESGNQRPQDRGVVYGDGGPGEFHVDFGDWNHYFEWNAEKQKVIKVVTQLFVM